MITVADLTDDLLARIIRETPVQERTMETAMLFLMAQGQSPGPAFRVPTEQEKERARQRVVDMFNAREARKEQLS